VVVASEGYPNAPKTGAQINGVAQAAKLEDVAVLHAGTTSGETGDFTASGGRLVTVVATGEDFATAQQNAYDAVGQIEVPNGQYGSDIAHRDINGNISIQGA